MYPYSVISHFKVYENTKKAVRVKIVCPFQNYGLKCVWISTQMGDKAIV